MKIFTGKKGLKTKYQRTLLYCLNSHLQMKQKRTVDELIEGYDAKKTDGLFYKLKKDFKLPAVLVLFDLINFKPKQIKSIDPRISTCRLGDKNSVARHSKMFEKVIESLKELDNESVLEINIVCGSYHAPCIDECLKSSTNLNNISLEMEELSSVPEISEKYRRILEKEIKAVREVFLITAFKFCFFFYLFIKSLI